MASANPFAALPFVRPLSASVLLVEAPDGARFPYANGFLFPGTETVLMDAGLGAERIRAVDRVRRIDALVISHSHPDHIHAWHELADRHLVLPRETPEAAFDLAELGRRFTGSADDGAYWAKMMQQWLGLRPLRPPDARFGHGQVLDLGSARLRAIHAPGHLLDHYCFFEEATGVLLTTDIDFAGFGPWYGNPEARIDGFEADIEALSDLPFTLLCSSHKPPLAGSDAAPLKRYARRLQRQRRLVLDQCRAPSTLEQVAAASPFYRNRFPDKRLQRIFETHLVAKNLRRLLEEGRVVLSADRYRAADPLPPMDGSGQESGSNADIE